MHRPPPVPDRPPFLTRRRLGFLLRVFGVLALGLLILAALAVALIPAEDRIDTLWEQAPPSAAGDGVTGRVLIDVQFVRGRGGNGQFVIEPVAAGEPIRVVAVFDQKAYLLDHGYIEDDSPGWTFQLRFQRRRWFPLNPHQYPQAVRLQLPRGVPLRIEGQVAWGESDLQLGGLSVRSIDWEVALGTHEIAFDESPGVPLERLSARGRVGALQLRGLGRASPRILQLSQTVGNLAIDLEGMWMNDASINARCLAAKCVVRAPDAATLILPDGRIWTDGMAPPPTGEIGNPQLRLSVGARLGSLTIGRGDTVDIGSDDR